MCPLHLNPENPPGLRATSPWNSLKTTRLLRCTSTLRTIKLLSPYSYLESPLSHLQSVPSCECKTLFHHLTGTEKGDNFPENGADFFWSWALTKTLSISNRVLICGGRRWDQKPAIQENQQKEWAKRAKKRRRERNILFKLIPLRPTRFPLQDSLKH